MSDLDLDALETSAQAALRDGAWYDRTDIREALDSIADIGDDTDADSRYICDAKPATVLALIAEVRAADRRERDRATEADLRARLAEVEAEKDECERQFQGKVAEVIAEMNRAEAAEQKVAALEAERDEWRAVAEERTTIRYRNAEQIDAQNAALAEVIEQVLGPESFRALGAAIHLFRCTNPDCRHYVDTGYFTPRDNDSASACQQWLRAALAAAPTPPAEANSKAGSNLEIAGSTPPAESEPCEHDGLGCGWREPHDPHAKVGDGRPCCGWPPRCDEPIGTTCPQQCIGGYGPGCCAYTPPTTDAEEA